MMTRSLKIALFAVMAVSVIAFGMGVAEAKSTYDRSASASDRDFVQRVVGDDMMSVQLGNMAWKQASNQQVRDFGRNMANAHGRAQQELMALADKNHIEYRRDMDREENETLKHMSTLKGHEFDRAFMRHVIQDHKKDLDMFERVSRESSNPDLRNYASRESQTLRKHLETAQNINDRLEKKG